MNASYPVKPFCGLLLSLAWLAMTSASWGADAMIRERRESEVPEPGLHYGRCDELPLPKTIFFGAGLDNIVADARAWSRRGVTAFFVDYVAREWGTDIWATDGKPWTIGRSDETLQKARKAAALCKEIGSQTFLKVAFDHTFDWFDDTAWQKIDNNFPQFAIFAREAQFDGIALDIEYASKQYVYDWEGYTYDGYTRADLVKKIDARMTGVMQTLYNEFPQMVLLTFPEQGLGLGGIIHRAWIEEAARRNAPGGVHYCTEWTYRNSNIRYVFGHVWGCHELFHRILSERAWRYWREKCSVVAGVWPFSSDDTRIFGPGIPLAQIRQGLAATLMVSPRYNWIYGSYTQEQLIGRQLDKYTGDEDIHAHLRTLADRAMVTDAKWVRLAGELRRGALRDFSPDLGVVPVPLFIGPSDKVQVRLVPTGPSMPDASNPRYEDAWALALRIFQGEPIDLKQHFGTVTDWLVIGPFASDAEFRGHTTVYPPEKSIDLAAKYSGIDGRQVSWAEHHQEGSQSSVDFTTIFKPTENVCAYALCYVTSPEETEVSIRIGTNDVGKMWVGGQLVSDNPHDDQVILDRDVVPVTLPRGTTPILLKVCNGGLDWGFVFRITDEDGKPVKTLRFSLSPD
ncbi:MAG: hypothetical protein ACC645_11275 [Pirellulales bacterium]